jgi:hypothetical protein
VARLIKKVAYWVKEEVTFDQVMHVVLSHSV